METKLVAFVFFLLHFAQLCHSLSFYDLSVIDIHGRPVSLTTYYGTVSLVVNVASNCGLTQRNYVELTQLQNKYESRGFQVLAFPCNQFNKQEPGTNQDVKRFATGNFSATFPMFAKSTVNDPMCEDGHPLGLAHCLPNSKHCCPPNNRVYEFLKRKLNGDIDWNFVKFLISRRGEPVKRWEAATPPLSLTPDIERALEEAVEEE